MTKGHIVKEGNMSVVTNVILSFSSMEEYLDDDKGNEIYPVMETINEWLKKNNHIAFSTDISLKDVIGGEKWFETPLFIAAFNYFDCGAFIEYLKSLVWKEPSCVQVFVQEQDEDIFTLYNLEGK